MIHAVSMTTKQAAAATGMRFSNFLGGNAGTQTLAVAVRSLILPSS